MASGDDAIRSLIASAIGPARTCLFTVSIAGSTPVPEFHFLGLLARRGRFAAGPGTGGTGVWEVPTLSEVDSRSPSLQRSAWERSPRRSASSPPHPGPAHHPPSRGRVPRDGGGRRPTDTANEACVAGPISDSALPCNRPSNSAALSSPG